MRAVMDAGFSAWVSKNGLFAGCILLHLGLIFVYSALCALEIHGRQRTAKNKGGIAANVGVYLCNVAPNAVVKIYTTALAMMTRQLAFGRNCYRPQSLTTFHERSAAWSGIGSAASGAWRNVRKHTIPWEMVGSLVYLGSVALLQTTAAGLIEATPFFKDTTPPLPQVQAIAKVQVDDLIRAFPIVNILPMVDAAEIEDFGFRDNIVYNIPSINTDTEDDITQQPALIFNVSCGVIPNALQSGNATYATINGTQTLMYPIHIDDSLLDVNVSAAPWTLSLVSPRPVDPSAGTPPAFIIAVSGAGVSDSAGSMPNPVTIQPPVFSCADATGMNCISVTSIQIFACNINATNTTVAVHSQSSAPDEQRVVPSPWHTWTLPSIPAQSYLVPVGQLPELSPQADLYMPFNFTGPDGRNQTATKSLSLLESSIMDSIGFDDVLYVEGGIGLVDIIDTLQSEIAAIYWRAGYRLAEQKQTADEKNGDDDDDDDPLETDTLIKINAYSPWIGLGLSVILLAIAVVSAYPTDSGAGLHNLGSPGVLQVTWMMGKYPQKAEELLANLSTGVASTPDVKQLLEAGEKIPFLTADDLERRWGDASDMHGFKQ